MNMKAGIGITTICAMLAGAPVFGYVKASELDESGKEAVATAPAEQVTAPEDVEGITEADATEVLGETSTAVTGADEALQEPKTPEQEEVPEYGTEITENEAEILPAEGEIAYAEAEEGEVKVGESVVDLAEAEVIPANGVNGSFVSRFQDTLPVVEGWTDELGRQLYDASAVRYEDENLARLAQEYLAQGYYISDLKREGELLGVGFGYGDYYFNTGFNVVDNMEGNNTFITYVAKISQSDFDQLVEELKDLWTKKSDTEYTWNDGLNDSTVTFDPATGILIYTNKFPADALG